MNYKELLEQEEQGRFELVQWTDRLIRAKNARSMWDADYALASKVLSNQVAIADSKNSLDKYTDQYFHTNWLLKLCIWMESYIMSADILADLKSHAGSDNTYPDRLLLEIELNSLLSKFEIVRTWSTQIIPDRIRYGYGVSYSGWNARARDPFNRNGKPNFLALDNRRVWVDESSSGINFKDRRWVFMKIEMDVEDAKELYPEFADKIAETPAEVDQGDSDNKKDRFDVYLCQYKKIKILRLVDVEVFLDGKKEIKQVMLSQVQDFIEKNPGQDLPDNMRILDENEEEPGYDAEVTCCYQFKFSPQIQEQLSPIEYIGDIDQFQFWSYHRIEGDIYPRGTTYMLKDEQTIKSILLTKAAIEAISNGHKTPVIEQGALTDEQEFVENHNSFGYVATISEEWRENHRGEKAIDFVDKKFDPQVTMFLNALLREDMQQFSGGTDTMMGQAQYSGMSAAQTGLLQASGATYTKADELSYRDYVKDVMECYLRQVAEFKTYEHTIEGVDEAGLSATIQVNPNDMTDWDWERYYVQPVIENSPEMIKQLKEQRAMQLNGMRAISTVRMLFELGYNNAEQLAAEAFQEAGILQLIQAMQENPELMQKVQAIIQNEARNAESSSPKE